MSIAALQTALDQYKTELKGSNTTRLAGAVFYHREWEVSANVNSNVIKNVEDLTQVHVYINDNWNGSTDKKLLVSSSLYSFDWKVFLPYQGTTQAPSIDADFGLDDLIDLSEAYKRAIGIKPDLVFNGVELVRNGPFGSDISVPAWVFFRFPTIYDESQKELPDEAGVLAVPARGAQKAQWFDQYDAVDWRAATLANLPYVSSSTTLIDEAVKIAKSTFASFNAVYTVKVTRAWGTSTPSQDLVTANVELEGTPNNKKKFDTLYLTLHGSAGPHWNGFEPPKLSDASKFANDKPWVYSPLHAKTLVAARKEAAALNTIDETTWTINQASDKVQYSFTKLDRQGNPDGNLNVDFYNLVGVIQTA